MRRRIILVTAVLFGAFLQGNGQARIFISPNVNFINALVSESQTDYDNHYEVHELSMSEHFALKSIKLGGDIGIRWKALQFSLGLSRYRDFHVVDARTDSQYPLRVQSNIKVNQIPIRLEFRPKFTEDGYPNTWVGWVAGLNLTNRAQFDSWAYLEDPEMVRNNSWGSGDDINYLYIVPLADSPQSSGFAINPVFGLNGGIDLNANWSIRFEYLYAFQSKSPVYTFQSVFYDYTLDETSVETHESFGSYTLLRAGVTYFLPFELGF